MEEKREWVWLTLILLLFLFVNVITADRYPFPFFDEVIYTDPAVNYLMGHGFTASVPGQDTPVFYYYNGPAHPALLVPWLKLFGISIRSVRSINVAYMTMTVLLIWSAAKRLALVRSTRWRLLLVVMLISDYSIILSYRCGRYDCLGMLAIAFAFWSVSFRSTPFRMISLSVVGAALPWIGLQLLPFAAVLGATLLAFTFFRYWREVGTFFAAVIVGGLGLVALFTRHGVLQYFLGFVHSQSKGPGFVGGVIRGELRHFNMLPKDFSLPLVVSCAVLLAVVLYHNRVVRWRSLLIYGLTFVVSLGLILILGAKFPTYYGWMTFIPLAICVCGSLHLEMPTGVRRLAVGLCVSASIIGVGLHVLACAGDWKDRDYSKVQQFISSNVQSDDRVYIDPQAYYPTKLTGAVTFFWDPGSRMSSAQKSRLTVCVIGPEKDWLLKELGGRWYRTGQELIPAHTGLFGNDTKWGFLSLPNYRLAVYRRVQSSEVLTARAAK